MSRGKLDYLFIVSRCVLTNEHSKKKSRDADERLCLHFGCVRWFQEIGVSFSRSLSSSLSESLKCAIIVHKSHKLFSVCVCFRCAFSIPPRSRKKRIDVFSKNVFYGGNTNRNLAPKNSTIPAYRLFFLSSLAMRSRSAASTASLLHYAKVSWKNVEMLPTAI
jgi:hypothetical protein